MLIENIRQMPEDYPLFVYENLEIIREGFASLKPDGSGLLFSFSSDDYKGSMEEALDLFMTVSDAFHAIKSAIIKEKTLFESYCDLPVKAIKVLDCVSISYSSDYLPRKEKKRAIRCANKLTLQDFMQEVAA